MSLIGNRITSLTAAAMLCAGLSTSAAAQMADTVGVINIEAVTVTIYRTKEPAAVPAPKPETRGQAPSKDAVWISGFWNLQGNPQTSPRAGWTWIPGRWATPPFRGAHYVPAHWGWSDSDHSDRWWSWIPGHWSRNNIFIDSSDQ